MTTSSSGSLAFANERYRRLVVRERWLSSMVCVAKLSARQARLSSRSGRSIGALRAPEDRKRVGSALGQAQQEFVEALRVREQEILDSSRH